MTSTVFKNIFSNHSPSIELEDFELNATANTLTTILVLMLVTETSGRLIGAEESVTADYTDSLKKLREVYGKVIVLYNKWYSPFSHLLEVEGVESYYLDFFALDCYRRLYINRENEVKKCHKIDPTHSFLFLVGKPNKKHRIETLYLLYKENLLDCANYSFQLNSKYVEKECLYMLNITEQEFKKFIRKQKILDVKYLTVTDNRDSHYTGIPFNKSIYEKSNFQIITETFCGDVYPWITEKTWLSIINKMPFVLIGDCGICEYMEAKGFKTFREYMPHPEFDLISSRPERVRLAVENIKYLNTNIINHQEDILIDIDHNYNLYHDIVNENLAVATQIVSTYSLNLDPIELFVGYNNHYPTQFKENL